MRVCIEDYLKYLEGNRIQLPLWNSDGEMIEETTHDFILEALGMYGSRVLSASTYIKDRAVITNYDLYNSILKETGNAFISTDACAFISQWGLFRSLNVSNLKRIYDALNINYEILDNYNGIEKRTVTSEDSGSDVNTNVSVDTHITDSKSTVKNNQSVSTENEVTPYDNNAFHDNDKSITSYVGEADETKVNGNGKDTSDGTTTMNYGKKNVTTDEFIRHGNLGVTTSQQMIQSELELRKLNNYVLTVVSMFINKYTYMV